MDRTQRQVWQVRPFMVIATLSWGRQHSVQPLVEFPVIPEHDDVGRKAPGLALYVSGPYYTFQD